MDRLDLYPKCKRCKDAASGMLIDGDGYLCPNCIMRELKSLRASQNGGWISVSEKIVDDLFVNGQGQEAERLVLMSCDRKDLGGWSRRAVVDRIVQALNEQPPTPVHDNQEEK